MKLSEAEDARNRSEAALTNLQVVLEQFQLGESVNYYNVIIDKMKQTNFVTSNKQTKKETYMQRQKKSETKRKNLDEPMKNYGMKSLDYIRSWRNPALV